MDRYDDVLNHNKCKVTSDGRANTLNARGLYAHQREKCSERSAAFGDIKRNLVNEVGDIKWSDSWVGSRGRMAYLCLSWKGEV